MDASSFILSPRRYLSVPGERPEARDESIVDDPPPAADGFRLADAHVAVARPRPERRGDVPRVELDATVDHGGRNAVGEEGVETGEARAIPGQIVVGAGDGIPRRDDEQGSREPRHRAQRTSRQRRSEHEGNDDQDVAIEIVARLQERRREEEQRRKP